MYKMKISKRTVWNLLVIVFVLSFFVTPLGFHGKVLLNQIFASKPDILQPQESLQIQNYDWKLKDADGNLFNFREAEGKTVFINFWASWRLPCSAELKGIQKLYEKYKGRVVFYIITDEEREQVIAFMRKNDFNFPVTYLIIGERAPFIIPEPPASYLIDSEGYIRIKQDDIADWDNQKVYDLFNELIDLK